MGTPVRYPNGVTNVSASSPFANMGQLSPMQFHTFFTDFDIYNASDWTLTTVELGAGSATEALTSGDGGLLLVTNDAADNDADFFQSNIDSFLMASGKKAFFAMRFKVSDATQSDFVMGLQITDTTPLDATDGIYFQKDDGDTQLDVYVRKDATTGSTSQTNIHTVVTDTFLTVAWAYDGNDEVIFYVDGAVKARLVATSTFLPDAVLRVSFGLQNGEAVAKTMTIDYVFAAKER